MVALYEDLMIGSLEGVAPLLHRLHDGQEHPIVHVVVLFATCAFSTVSVDHSENPKTIILIENAGYGKAACIGQQNNQLSSAKCNSVRKPYANLPDTPVALASASKYFQMLPAPPGALQSALRLCKSSLTCSSKHLQ
jgi:hypothetical protein